MATGGNGISKDMAARLTAVAHDLADAARIETLKLFRSPDLRPDNKAAAGFAIETLNAAPPTIAPGQRVAVG